MEPGDIIRRIYGYVYGRPMNFSFIDEFVCGSARPFSSKEVEYLRKDRGVSTILSLTETPLSSEWLDGLSYKHIPIRNHVSPTLGQLSECVNFLLAEVQARRKIDVHCAAGKGRTGTILAGYMCARYGLAAREAIEQVRAKRPGSIERNVQESVISEFSRTLSERSAG